MVKKLQAIKAKKGFTLVELIVVIAIIGVLAAILIPTLSGVIESSRKRSAESTCQSLQTQAKTFAQNVMSKTGNMCTPSTTCDMDEEGETFVASDSKFNMKGYLSRQLPEIEASNSTKGARVELANGQVATVVYTEGAFTAYWTVSGGTGDTYKGSAAPSGAPAPASAGTITVQAAAAATP